MKCMETSPWYCEPFDRKFVFDLQLFAGEKTEDPTSKRKSDARAKGQIPRSQELSGAFVMLGGFWALKTLGGSVYTEICNYMVYIFNHMNQGVDTETVMNLFIGIIIVLAKTAFPIMGIIMVVGLCTNFIQVGINFTTEPLGFKIENLNPINGLGRLVSKRALVELVKSVFKILIIGSFIYNYIKDELMKMPQLLYLDLNASLPKIADVILMLAFKILTAYFILSVLDYAYQKWDNFQSMKMSKEEVKEEFKQMEGDPQIKGKIKAKQREMAMFRMMKEVPNADVIVTNPTHFAVALKYERGMRAPLVVAKGQDYVAQKIKEVAREAGVTIVENRPLARALYASVEIGQSVPQELYKSVAEVLAYVYRLKHRRYA